MKIIFSRKGFDSTSGGCPSPIFPDDTMYSIPIQGIGEKVSYQQINKGNQSAGTRLADVVRDLTRGRVTGDELTHFDPDLNAAALPREAAWRPCFGQGGAALSHLIGQGVGIGDVFLFYGWFRRVQRSGKAWRYVPGSRHLHVVFGWLQVDEMIEVSPDNREGLLTQRPWLRDHPHMHVPPATAIGGNAIYIGAETLTLPGVSHTCQAGGGELLHFSDRRILTASGSSNRSLWHLPQWCLPTTDRSPLSFHEDGSRWRVLERVCEVATVGRGQEFVLDCSNRSDASAWLNSLLA